MPERHCSEHGRSANGSGAQCDPYPNGTAPNAACIRTAPTPFTIDIGVVPPERCPNPNGNGSERKRNPSSTAPSIAPMRTATAPTTADIRAALLANATD